MVKNLIPWRKKENVPVVRRENMGDPFELLHRRMNDLFDEVFAGSADPFSFGLTQPLADAAPKFEVSETDREVEVKAELPGMSEQDVEVLLDETSLTISGEKKQEQEDKRRDYYLSEVRYGSFRRVLPLPPGVDRDKVKASFKNGVLRLTLPKEPGTARKRIDISAE